MICWWPETATITCAKKMASISETPLWYYKMTPLMEKLTNLFFRGYSNKIPDRISTAQVHNIFRITNSAVQTMSIAAKRNPLFPKWQTFRYIIGVSLWQILLFYFSLSFIHMKYLVRFDCIKSQLYYTSRRASSYPLNGNSAVLVSQIEWHF